MNLQKLVESCFKALLRTPNPQRYITRIFSDGKNISEILRRNEDGLEYESGLGVKRLFANQVGCHSPIQDAWGEARLLHSDGVMFGVFDGNNGTACSHVVAKRIFRYVAVALLPKELLEAFIRASEERFRHLDIVNSLQDKHFFLEEYGATYERSLSEFARDLLRQDREYGVREALVRAYERLDSDLSREAAEDASPERRMLWVGMTGTCGTVAHLSGRTLTTAIAGDALVVVGTERGEARVLTPEHNVENAAEVERLGRAHPGEEVLSQGLLLGSLTSFRSFGNFRYKWSRAEVEERIVPFYGPDSLPDNSLTPPYVSVVPDVGEYTLQPEDSFIVIASDGIWDIFPPSKEQHIFFSFYGPDSLPDNSLTPPYVSVVPDVGEYTLQPEDSFIVIASDGIWDIFPPSKVVEIVSRYSRHAWLKNLALAPVRKAQRLLQIVRQEPEREEAETFGSPATQLISEALVATSKRLHLPRRYSRNIRDDMTVLVVFLDREVLRASLSDQPPLRTRIRSLAASLRELLSLSVQPV